MCGDVLVYCAPHIGEVVVFDFGTRIPTVVLMHTSPCIWGSGNQVQEGFFYCFYHFLTCVSFAEEPASKS